MSSVHGINYSLTLCNTFLDLLTSHGFTQLNLQPTHIFLTNHPALISNTEVIPGISDHEEACTIR